MQVRHAIAAVTIAAFALTLSACTTGAPPPQRVTRTRQPRQRRAPGATPGPTTTPKSADTPAGEIRDVTDGFDLASTADALRTGFPSFADQTRTTRSRSILNAGCDGIDATGNPSAARTPSPRRASP